MSHDTVQLMQAQYFPKLRGGKKGWYLTNIPSNWNLAKEVSSLHIRSRLCSFGLTSGARVDFPLKPLQLLILRKWDYCLNSIEMKNCLYLQAVCLFRKHSRLFLLIIHLKNSSAKTKLLDYFLISLPPCRWPVIFFLNDKEHTNYCIFLPHPWEGFPRD